MIISIMCDPATWGPPDSESKRGCGHTFHDKGVHHLSRDRHVTLCGKDCGNFVFIVRVDSREFVPTDSICQICVGKLG